MPSHDSLKTHSQLTVGDKTYAYYSLPAAEAAGLTGISRLPVSMKVLLENLLRNEDGESVTEADLKAVSTSLRELEGYLGTASKALQEIRDMRRSTVRGEAMTAPQAIAAE